MAGRSTSRASFGAIVPPRKARSSMNVRSRRSFALLSATAALAGGSLTTITAAANAADTPSQTSSRLLGLDLLSPVLGLILGQVTGATVATVQTLIAPLTPAEGGDLLQAADATQLTKLLAAAQGNGQLTGALGTLTAAETGELLARVGGTDLATVLGGLTSGQLAGALDTLTPAQLTTLVGGLTPAQITSLLAAGGTDSVVTGLLGQATALAGGAPTAPQVDTLVAQVNALLGGGIPADPTDLASLLMTLGPLLATPGLDASQLGSLLSTANGLLGVAPAPVAAPLQALATQLTVILTPVTGGGGTTPGAGVPGPATTTPVTTTTQPGAITTRPGATVAPFTAYRASVGALKLNKKRTSMRFTVACAATAPKGCLVKVSAQAAGKTAGRAKTLALLRGRSTTITVKLSKSTTRRLKSRGGTLKVTAQTALSSLPSATRTLKVKRLKKAR